MPSPLHAQLAATWPFVWHNARAASRSPSRSICCPVLRSEGKLGPGTLPWGGTRGPSRVQACHRILC
eukprot:scaffold932_cov328-Pavlova_lutheri.AAC.13